MNLRELDSFKLSDAVVFHDSLNPRLWKNERLLPEVKQQLEIIAEDFLEELGVSGLTVKDITVSGSNAAFSYTPHSDLDLHILVDMSKLPNDEVYLELFNAKKNIYNDSHDIKVHGIPVELYVQDSNKPVVSLGEYSLLQDKWLRIPVKRRSNFDQTATQSKYEKLVDIINDGLKSKDLEKIDNILKTIKRYRGAGLEKAGEFGPENLAYKAVRSQGLLDQLYDLRDQLHSQDLSIDETMNYVQVPDVKVGMTVHHNFLPKGGTVVKIEDSNKAVVRALHDNRLYRFNLSSLNKPIHEDNSLQFAAEKTPDINPYGGLRDTQFRGAISETSNNQIKFKLQKGKNKFALTLLVDNKEAGIYQYDSNTGRSIAEVFPEFKGKGYGKLLVLNAIYTAAMLGMYFYEDESRTEEYNNVIDSLESNGYIVSDEDGSLFVTDIGEQFLKQSLNEASGYIPSEKEKNDPRFKTALTVDVKPNSIKNNAKAFGFNISRAGIPPLLR